MQCDHGANSAELRILAGIADLKSPDANLTSPPFSG